MPDIISTLLTVTVCGGALALAVYGMYRAARNAAANPRQYDSDDDEEFWEADSPEESPPDFY